MKKSYVLLCFILISSSFSLLKAQTNAATPNASFTDWTHFTANGGYDDPNSWQCLNPSTAPYGTITCYKDSTNPLPGCKYDVILLTQQVLSIVTAPGALTTGTVNTTNYSINGGIPYTLSPDSIIGWYKYTSVSGDNGDCEFYLFGATHSDTIAKAFFSTPTSNVTSWTRFSFPVTYLSINTPDTALWIFSSSINQTGAKVGSTLYLDSLGLVFNTTGINNVIKQEFVTVGPNPTSGLISINNSSTSNTLLFTLTDVTGRKLEENKLTSGINNLELTKVQDGVYIYSILDENNSVVKTGKIVVQK